MSYRYSRVLQGVLLVAGAVVSVGYWVRQVVRGCFRR